MAGERRLAVTIANVPHMELGRQEQLPSYVLVRAHNPTMIPLGERVKHSRGQIALGRCACKTEFAEQ